MYLHFNKRVQYHFLWFLFSATRMRGNLYANFFKACCGHSLSVCLSLLLCVCVVEFMQNDCAVVHLAVELARRIKASLCYMRCPVSKTRVFKADKLTVTCQALQRYRKKAVSTAFHTSLNPCDNRSSRPRVISV